jgi:hypothetical protein
MSPAPTPPAPDAPAGRPDPDGPERGDAVEPTPEPATSTLPLGSAPASEGDRQLAETVRSVSRLEEAN